MRFLRYVKITAIFVLVTYFWITIKYATMWKTPMSIPNADHEQDPNPSQKLILLWSTRLRRRGISAWDVVDENFTSCSKKCSFTIDKSLFNKSHAVLYHGYPEIRIRKKGKWHMYPLPKPKYRNPNQIWIYYTLEPPSPYWDIYETFDDHYDFNWTMTYRTDSDIWFPYGMFQKRKKPLGNFEAFLDRLRNSSKRLAVALISRCNRPSGRDEYVRQLQKIIPVDIYGKCGNHSCDKTKNCHKLLASNYKFWLSFENSICSQYITEKLFLPLQNGIVPVFYGHNSIKDMKSIAQDAFINTNDFKSPRALGKYLLQLDQNPEKYKKFFEFHKKYEIVVNPSKMAWCEVCKKLHNVNLDDKHKSYKSVIDWFLRNNSKNAVCEQPYLG